MPVYEYECPAHGLFEQLRPLAEYAALADCPTCATSVSRVLSAPHLCGMPRSTLVAHERNEQSCHAPRMAGAEARPRQEKPPPGERPALKRYSGARPWVIEHG